MASPDLSLDDLFRGFDGIEYLNLYLDYAMVLNVEYDGQPDNTLVSLMPEPQQEETRLIDACLAEHRDELSIRRLRCPQCRCTEKDKRKTTCEKCDRPLEAVRVATEESLRREAWKRLRREIPGFQARSVVPRWLAAELYPGRGTPPDPRLELSLVFERILEGMRTTRERRFRDSWDHLSLGKSVSVLLPPRDETLDVKHYHYRGVRQKLIDGYRWLVIRERQHPDFIEADAQHRSLECFPPEVKLPFETTTQTPYGAAAAEPSEAAGKRQDAPTQHAKRAGDSSDGGSTTKDKPDCETELKKGDGYVDKSELDAVAGDYLAFKTIQNLYSPAADMTGRNNRSLFLYSKIRPLYVQHDSSLDDIMPATHSEFSITLKRVQSGQ